MKPYEEFIIEIRELYAILASIIAENNYSEQKASEAFKHIVCACVPSVANLMKDKDWTMLWNKYNNRVKDILANPDVQNRSVYLIDYALHFYAEREADKESAYNLFGAFDNTVQELFDVIQTNPKLQDKFKKKLESKIIEVVNDGQRKADEANNSSFKNYVNEIAFFYYIAKHPCLCLSEIEKEMPNGKKADFHLVCDNSEYFVDTITIHDTSSQKDINRFIEGKINDKFDKKTQNLHDQYIMERVRVLAIVEYEDERLLNYSPALPPDKCFPPMIPLMESSDRGNIITLHALPFGNEIKNKLTNK